MESTSGKFSGIGVSIMNKRPEEDVLNIIGVIQSGPAAKAGLQKGDKIVGVNDEGLKGLSSDEVIAKLRGKTGTKVKLKILRNEKPIEIEIVRNIIKDQNLICYHFKNQKIYYFAIKMFAENTHKQMEKLLTKAQEDKSKGIIIDLRRNPGGVLDSAVNMVGLFVKKGSLVASTKGKNDKTINSYHTNSDPIFNKKMPIFILTDNFTASASEIFAGCLRHYSNQKDNNLSVFVVGTKTFGKGSVQEVIPISNGCAIKLTTMRYVLPNGVEIQAKGILPDVKIQPKIKSEDQELFAKNFFDRESSLKNHIPANGEKSEKIKTELPNGKETKEEIAKNWEKRFVKSIANDNQIQECVNMISMVNLHAKLQKEIVKRDLRVNMLKNNYLTDDSAVLVKVGE